MKVESTIQENREAKLTVLLESEYFEKAKHRAAQEISKRIRIPGFRPGKAPYEIVRRMVGEETILEETLERVVNEIYPKALDETGIEPAAAGRLEEYQVTPEVKFTFSVPLEPEVTLPEDYRQLRIPYEPPVVTEEEVQKFLYELQKNYAILEVVDRPAQMGDVVSITIREKGQPEPARSEPLQIYLEQTPSADELTSKLIESLVGRKSGDEYEITLPSSQGEGDSAPMDAIVQVKEVHAATLPTFDELASQFFLESSEALEKIAREAVIKSKEEAYFTEYIGRVVDTLQERTRFAYSPALLEKEVQAMLNEFESSLAQSGLSLEAFLKERGLTREEFVEKEIRPEAKRRFEQALLLGKVFSQEQLEVSDSAVNEHLAEHFASMRAQGIDPRKYMKNRENAIGLLEHVYQHTMQKVTLDFLKDLASGDLERREQEKRAAAEAKDAEEPAMAEEGAPSSAEAQGEADQEAQAAEEGTK